MLLEWLLVPDLFNLHVSESSRENIPTAFWVRLCLVHYDNFTILTQHQYSSGNTVENSSSW